MAEGQLTSPILGNFSDLGKMLVEGTARVNKIKDQVAEERNLLNKGLTESIKDIQATSITEFDKVIHSGAQQFRSRLAEAVRQNKQGLISRSDVSALASSFQTQAGILANTTELYNKNAERIQKGIDAGTLSQMDMDDYNAVWFQDDNYAPILKKGNTSGKPLQGLRASLIGDALHFSVVKQIKGEGGEVEDVIVVANRKATDFLNPNIKATPKFNIDKEVKTFKGIIGKQTNYISRDGIMYGSPFSSTNTQQNGDITTTTTIAPGFFPSFVNQVENRVAKIDKKLAAQILYENLGARSLLHDDTFGNRTKDQWESDFEDIKVTIDGVEQSEPRYYDKNGDKINLTKDPMLLDTAEDGSSVATEEQVELAKSIYRQSLLNSFNVTRKDFVDKRKITTKPRKKDPVISFGVATINRMVFDDEAQKKLPTLIKPDGKYYRDIALLGKMAEGNPAVKVTNADGVAIDFNQTRAQMRSSGEITGIVNAGLSGEQQELFSDDNNFYSFTLSDGALDKTKEDLTFTSVQGTPMVNLRQLAVIENPNGEALSQIIILGDSVLSESADKFKAAAGGAASEEITDISKKENTVTTYSVLDGEKAAQLYAALYKNESFKEIMKDLGFEGESAKSSLANGDYITAFQAFANSMK